MGAVYDFTIGIYIEIIQQNRIWRFCTLSYARQMYRYCTQGKI